MPSVRFREAESQDRSLRYAMNLIASIEMAPGARPNPFREETWGLD